MDSSTQVRISGWLMFDFRAHRRDWDATSDRLGSPPDYKDRGSKKTASGLIWINRRSTDEKAASQFHRYPRPRRPYVATGATEAGPSPTPNASAPATTSGPCATDYYRNVNGVCVHRPVKTQGSAVPACRDGTMSGRELFLLQHRRGTCSHHGGVAKWL